FGMVGAVRGEIDLRDRAAGGIDPRGEPLGELAAIERLGTAGRDGMERRGEVGLLEHLAGARPATAWTEDPRCLLVVGEALALGGDRGGESVAHREAVLGVADRRLERAIEAEPAMLARQVREPRDDARDGREDRALPRERVAEPLAVDGLRRRAGAVVRGHVTRPRVVDEREHVAAEGRA